MRNFTNNFKQFTSRLSARWLIMALMLLVGTSSAWGADYYLKGTFNGWGTGDKFSGTSGNITVAITLNEYTTYQFKINSDNNWYGNDGQMVQCDSENWEMSTSAGDCNIVTSIAGEYLFTFNTSNKKLTVTYPIKDIKKSVLNGEFAFYVGEPTGWNTTHFLVYKDSKKIAACKNENFEKDGYNIGIIYATAEKYYATHDKWQGLEMPNTSKQGCAYLIYNSGGDKIKEECGTSPLCDFTIDNTIQAGETSTVSITSSGRSKYGTTDYTIDSYYAKKADESDLLEISVDNNELQTQDLEVGTYTIYALLFDGRIYAKGGEQTLTVETACEKPAAPQLSVNKKINVCEGKDNTYGYIEIDNYDSYSSCKFYLGSENNEITNNISEGLIGVNEPSSYKVIVKNGCGSTNEATIDFTATNILTPTGSVSISGNSPICSGEKATLTANVTTSNTISSYTWTKNDGSAHGGTLSNSDKTLTTAALQANTSYKVSVTLANSGCTKTFAATNNPYTVTVNTAPSKPTISSDKTKVVGSEKAKISVANPDNSLTYTLYKDGTATIQTGTSFDVAAGTYQVKATKSSNAANCKDSELSDKIVISSCTPNATLVNATYNQSTGKIDLRGNLTETCDKTLYYGFLWKVKGDAWNTENAISGTGNPYNKTDVSNTVYNQSWDGAAEGVTYVITAYALNASTNPYTWYYDETGIEVSKCITVATPNVTAAPVCAGSEATLTLNNKQDNVVYKLNRTPIFTSGNTYTVRPEKTTTYTITATSTISCEVNQTATTTVKVEVKDLPEPPAISSGTTVCPNTAFELPSIGDGKWYAQEEGGSAYGSNIITNGVAETTYYYAEAVKNGCSSATRTKYTVNVHTTPATPKITAPESVGQNKDFNVTIGNLNADDNDYALYKGTDKVQDITTGTITLKAPNDLGNVTYTVKAVYKSCAELKSEASFTINVVEAGVQIKFTGDASIDPNDPVDFVSMYVDNDGLGDFAEAGVAVTAYTWEYSTDGNTWTPCASTNTASGITYSVLGMTNGTANCNNFRPSAVGQYRCTVTYNVTSGNNTVSSNILTVKDDATTAKTFKDVTMTLPVISVNTGASKFPVNNFGGTPSKNADKMKEKISVDVKIFENIGGETKVVYDRKARMNYRGSSSLNFLKKSYAFCPGEEKCGDKKGKDYVKTAALNMLGVGDALDKDWVLYAAAADPSLMRNRLMFDTFADMTGGWSVNSRYVELVVNGEYKGVYVLMDKITVNENRVNVAWKQDASGATTQKGFIVKFDKTDIADRYENTSGDQKTFKSTYSGHDGFTTYDTQIDQRFEIEYPEKEDIEEDDSENGKGPGEWSDVFNTIKEMFNKFEYELAKGNFSEVQKLIDYTSWADWFIITEFGKNIDGYRASNLFVYDEKGSGKIEARPLWDQELSFNNQCPNYYASYGANSENGLMVDKSNDEAYNNDASTPFWFTGRYKGGRGTYNGSDQTFKGLLDDPCFVAEVKARWAKHVGTNGALTSSALTTKMKGYLADLDKDHKLASSTINSGTPLHREFYTFWKNKSRKTIDCVATTGCPTDETGYTDQGFYSSKNNLNNWLVGDRGTNLGNIINGWEGTALSISFAVTPAGGVTTPWEPVMVEVINPSGYEYDFEYTTGELNKVSGVIIKESNDKYTYRIPRPADWGYGNGERADVEYGIKATLKVAEGEAQCGNSTEAPTATATIKLTDEEDDANCEIK